MSTPYRHEIKYRMNAMEAALTQQRAQSILRPDPHVDANGIYQIKSLYFDDYQDSCLEENVAGVDHRSKFRIRIYNDDPSFIHLEKKSKVNGMTRKESCKITREQCEILMEGRYPAEAYMDKGTESRLLREMQMRLLQPKVIVQYERAPYIYEPGNVRITFDRCLCSSGEIRGFLEPAQVMRPIFPMGESLLEVKWDELLPQILRRHLALDSLQWTGFSKYALCRQYNVWGS